MTTRFLLLATLLAATQSGPLLAQVPPPGGFAITTVSRTVTWSDGIKTIMDIRYPTVAPPTTGWPGVLCSHGRGGNRGRIAAMATHLAKRGYITFAFDIRPYGVTSGPMNPPNFDSSAPRRLLDGAEAFHLVKQHFPKRLHSTRLAAVGRSMGGGISARLASYSGRTLPLVSTWVHKGPELKAIGTMIAPIAGIDSKVTANGDLLRAEIAGDLEAAAPSPQWTMALAGNYHLLRAAMIADPMMNVIPGLEKNKIPIHSQMGWDDGKFAPSFSMDVLPKLGGAYKGLVTGPGHGSPANTIDKALNLDSVGRFFDLHVQGRSNGVDLEPRFESAVTPMSTTEYTNSNSAWAHRFTKVWPPQTPATKSYLRSNSSLTSTLPVAIEPSVSIPHAVPGGYDLASFVADGSGASPIQVFTNLPLTIKQFVGPPLQREKELYGRPKITAFVSINQPHFQLSASLWARSAQGNERYLSGGTCGRRVAAVGTHAVTIEMRDVSYIVPAGFRIVVKLHNMSWERPHGQNYIMWTPDLQGSVSMLVRITPANPAVLHLPVRAQRGVNFTPRLDVVSAAAGFAHQMRIDAGPTNAGRPYGVYIGVSGIAPGVNIGRQIWLNPDALTMLAIGAMNTPVLANFLGVLDANGRANPSLNLPAGIGSIAGLRLSMVTILTTPTGPWPSEPIQLDINP